MLPDVAVISSCMMTLPLTPPHVQCPKLYLSQVLLDLELEQALSSQQQSCLSLFCQGPQ